MSKFFLLSFTIISHR